MTQKIEELLAKILQALSKKFQDTLVLKGGMLLRLLGSPRLTRDIDFVILSKQSKKILILPIREALQSIEGVRITKEDLNSRGIFIDVRDDIQKIETKIEIAVLKSTHLPPEPLSSVELMKNYALDIQIVMAMAVSEAFSHKIAASIERETVRDLYDLSQYEPLGPFDIGTLKERLSKICIARQKPVSLNFEQAAQMLKNRILKLTEADLKKDLYSSMPSNQRSGLLRIIQAATGRIAQRIEILD